MTRNWWKSIPWWKVAWPLPILSACSLLTLPLPKSKESWVVIARQWLSTGLKLNNFCTRASPRIVNLLKRWPKWTSKISSSINLSSLTPSQPCSSYNSTCIIHRRHSSKNASLSNNSPILASNLTFRVWNYKKIGATRRETIKELSPRRRMDRSRMIVIKSKALPVNNRAPTKTICVTHLSIVKTKKTRRRTRMIRARVYKKPPISPYRVSKITALLRWLSRTL